MLTSHAVSRRCVPPLILFAPGNTEQATASLHNQTACKIKSNQPMIDEAKGKGRASQEAKKQRKGCMIWPLHLHCTSWERIGSSATIAAEDPIKHRCGLRWRSWSADGSSGCNVYVKHARKTGLSLHRSCPSAPPTMVEVVGRRASSGAIEMNVGV